MVEEFFYLAALFSVPCSTDFLHCSTIIGEATQNLDEQIRNIELYIGVLHWCTGVLASES